MRSFKTKYSILLPYFSRNEYKGYKFQYCITMNQITVN